MNVLRTSWKLLYYWRLIKYKDAVLPIWEFWDRTILRPSYLHNWISYTGKTSLYWVRSLVETLHTVHYVFSQGGVVTNWANFKHVTTNLSMRDFSLSFFLGGGGGGGGSFCMLGKGTVIGGGNYDYDVTKTTVKITMTMTFVYLVIHLIIYLFKSLLIHGLWCLWLLYLANIIPVYTG